MPRARGTEVDAPLHVLVVDDSAVVRQAFTLVLSRHPGMTVETASDPIIAMERIRRRRPSVLVLDLEMPRMDGLTFLRQLMRDDPLPVVVCSGRVSAGSEAAVRALEEGAVELIAKPDLGVGDFLRESSTLLVDTVRAAARARPRPRRPEPPRSLPGFVHRISYASPDGCPKTLPKPRPESLPNSAPSGGVWL